MPEPHFGRTTQLRFIARKPSEFRKELSEESRKEQAPRWSKAVCQEDGGTARMKCHCYLGTFCWTMRTTEEQTAESAMAKQLMDRLCRSEQRSCTSRHDGGRQQAPPARKEYAGRILSWLCAASGRWMTCSGRLDLA